MIFVLDNNLPPALAHGLAKFTAGTHPQHAVQHLSDLMPRNTPDAEWIKQLAADGKHVVVTQDRLNKGLEREALRRAGLLVFMLDKGWAQHPFWPKAANLVSWWPRVIEMTENIQGGAAFRVPWRKSGTGRFEQIKL